MSDRPFEGLSPALLWKHFEALTRSRRPSGDEDEAFDYARAWAEERGYDIREDDARNLVIKVPGSPGREEAPTVVIQGHLDMVCERNSDSPYDAAAGRMRVFRDGDWITADGTTLGADNGIGVAAGMAAAEDPEIERGPLELVLTRDEETGLTGAKGLDAANIDGRIMLNLDSEEDGMLFVGCSGGMDTHVELELEMEAAPAGWRQLTVKVSGLTGGHSGLDINRNRPNAIKVLTSVLRTAGAESVWRLMSFDGGNMRNAIPREATAQILVDPTGEEAFRAGLETARKVWIEQAMGVDEGLTIELIDSELTGGAGDEAAASATHCCTLDSSNEVLDLLTALPSGVIGMSQELEGLVESSTNLGVAKTDGSRLKIIMCSRSSSTLALREVLETINASARMAGADAEEVGGYPGWQPDMDSPVLSKTKVAYARLYGNEPAVTAIHAGLECGLIGERLPEMDMISFGPEITGAHSPDERVHIGSVERFYGLLRELLKELSG